MPAILTDVQNAAVAVSLRLRGSHFKLCSFHMPSSRSVDSYDEQRLFPKTALSGKSVPLQAWSGSEGSRKLRFPDFMTTAQGGGKVVSLKHRPHLPPGNFIYIYIYIYKVNQSRYRPRVAQRVPGS